MGLNIIDIYTLMIIKPDNLDVFLSSINSNVTITDNIYPATLILSNIFGYLFITLFIICLFMILKIIKRKIKRIID